MASRRKKAKPKFHKGSYQCWCCADKGFVRFTDGDVGPCPRCNEDSGYEPGQYEAELVEKKGRCQFVRGGGGRQCIYWNGHEKELDHTFMCGV